MAAVSELLLLGLVLLFNTPTDAQIALSDDRVVLRSELGVNTGATDYGPAFYRDGLVYVSPTAGKLKKRLKAGRSRTPELTHLWLARVGPAGQLAAPQPFLSDFKGKVNVGPVTFSSDGKQVYLTRNAEGGRRKDKGARRLQIYESQQLESGGWTPLRGVDFADESGNDAHPSLAPDGSWMVFVSDRKGGFGGLDLWGVRREGDGWGAPFNLGLGVNTGGNEGFPFLHEDGTLYFATTVSGANGGEPHLDIVYSREEADGWMDPVRLGDPFNSLADDFGLIVSPDNERGYFSSARAGGVGEDDLYGFEIIGAADSRQSAELAIQVSDAVTGDPLQGAAVTYLNTDATSLTVALETGIVSVDGDPLQVVGGENYMTDISGSGKIRTVAGTYLIEVSREGYESVQIPLVLRTRGTSLPIVLSPKRACGSVRVSVLDQRSLLPIAGASLSANRGAATGDPGAAVPPGTVTGVDGTVTVCLPCGELYTLSATAGGLTGKPVSYSTRDATCRDGDPGKALTIYLAPGTVAGRPSAGPTVQLAGNPLSAGTRLQLPSVFYALNESSLTEAARDDLDELAKLMNRFGDMRVELGSHTDAIGYASFNKALSQRRADEAKRYLVEQAGIDAARIVATGYGESRPRNGCRDGVPCSAAQHRENRRTEVVILDKDGKGAELSVGFVPNASRRRRPGPEAPTVPSERSSATTSAPSATESTPARSTPNAKPDAIYLVIAGTFTAAADAANRLTELRELGYEGVRVESVPGVNGRSVIAGRFEDEARAKTFARALDEAHGIKAAVKALD